MVTDWIDALARADHISAAHADNLLRDQLGFASIDWTGHVESPMGHATLLHITRDDIADYASREGDPWVTERRNFAPGWYVVRTDSNGFVFGHAYADEATARADFKLFEHTYARWADEIEEN